MQKRTYAFLLVTMLLVSLGGCDRKGEKRNVETAQEERVSTLAHTPQTPAMQTTEQTKPQGLSRLGIEKHGDKIVIDLNRTQAYMQRMANKLKKKSEKIRDAMQKGAVRIKEAGIDINDKYVHIDINKTEKALQSWMKDMEAMSKELQESVREIANDLNESGLVEPQTP